MSASVISLLLLVAQSTTAHPALATVRGVGLGISAIRRADVREEIVLGPVVDAAAAAVVDDRGMVRYGHRPYAVRPLASVTKLLTALAVVRATPRWDDAIVIEAADISPEGHTVLTAGDRVSVRDGLTALLVYSDNAAANALARAVAPSRVEFLARMRVIAAELALSTIRVADPAGLDAGNVGSAADAARLAAAAFAVPEIRERATMPEASLAVGTRTVRVLATNLIIRDRTRTTFTTIGGKTGHLDEAGYNLVLLAERGGQTVAVAVLGSPAHDARYRAARALADWTLRAVGP